MPGRERKSRRAGFDRSTSTEGFNELAEEAIDWTRDHLSADDRAWLADLRLTRQVRDFTIVHATLDTPGQWGYVFNDLDATASFTYQHTSLCFFGHTHWPTAFVRDDNVRRIPRRTNRSDPGKRYFINGGSVGQPRDRDWRAAYCIFHVDRQVVEQRRVKYDLETRRRKFVTPVCRIVSPIGSRWGVSGSRGA